MSSRDKSVNTEMKKQDELKLKTVDVPNDALSGTSNASLYGTANDLQDCATKCLSTDVNTCNVSPEDSSKKELKTNESPDPDRSNQFASTCCTRDRNELLHDIKKFDPSTLKPGHIESTPILSQTTAQEITYVGMICWKNGIHPNDPLAARFRDTEESDNDSDNDDDDDYDEWDD